MRPRLFLTGDMGVGKSTAIRTALGDRLPMLGGFLTRRHRGEDGLSFTLSTPDGQQEQTFLDFSTGKPVLFPVVFETLGLAALQGDILVLDEIGGMELLCPAFWAALERVLQSDIPILGVVKGLQPQNALAQALGLDETYRRQAEKLWHILTRDESTLVYPCQQYDETALALARQWAGEYCL